MIRRLQVSMSGEALSRRITERIRIHSELLNVLDARIKARDGDTVFDVRAEDDFKTFGALKSERQHHQERRDDLTLLRDHLVAVEFSVTHWPVDTGSSPRTVREGFGTVWFRGLRGRAPLSQESASRATCSRVGRHMTKEPLRYPISADG